MTTLRRQLVLLTFLISVACASNPAAPDSNSMPAWLTALVRQSEAQPVANPPAFIASYDYKGADFFRERRNEQIIWRDTRGAP